MYQRSSNILCLVAAAAGLAAAKIAAPTGIKTCADDQPNVVECRRQALQQLVPLLGLGLPEIGAAPIDPLAQSPLQWKSSTHGIDLTFKLENPRYYGLSTSIVDDLHVDTNNHRIHLTAHIDGINVLEGSHSLQGNVLSVPMDGKGQFKLTMHGGIVDVQYAGHPVPGKGGDIYLKLDTVSVRLTLGKSHYELTGIFGDYPPLVAAGNTFVNSVAAGIVEPDLIPTLEKWLAETYKQHAQAVFNTVPYNQLFPKTSAITGFYRSVYPYYL